MKRFHVHLHVDNLTHNVDFYSKLFAAEPARHEADYAKWMLDDPRINFAISTRGKKAGIDHVGLQADNAQELAELAARAMAPALLFKHEGNNTCCYARSEKHWITDPQGLAWEQFRTLAGNPLFNDAAAVAEPAKPAATTQACC
jgi:hypothetical protein